MTAFSGSQTEASLHRFDLSSAQHLVLKGVYETSYSLKDFVFSYMPFPPAGKGTGDAAYKILEN